MTLTGLKALETTTPQRFGRRALAVAAVAGIGGALWTLGDAASPHRLGPLNPPTPPATALAPAAWTFDPARWHGIAGLPTRLADLGLQWPGFLLALLCVAGAALAVVHPGAFQRPAPYRLPRSRAVIAYVSALLIGMALPATVFILVGQLGPGSSFDLDGAMRVMLGVVVFCACLWTLAGQDIWHPRALVRFTHGGMAGFGIAAAFMVAALFLTPLDVVARAGPVAMAIRDLGLGRPGATWGTVLAWRVVVVGVAFALAGAFAVTAGPQSVGSRPRLGAGTIAGALVAVLLVAGWSLARAADRLRRDLDPDVVAELGLTPGAPRAVALLPGGGRVAVPRRSGGHDAETLRLYRECTDEQGNMPAPSAENVERLGSALVNARGVVSMRTSRMLACLAVLHALRFEPVLAEELLFLDEAPGRLPPATFAAAVRGVMERTGSPTARRWLTVLTDTSRFTGPADLRAPLLRRLDAPIESTGTVTGILAVDAPALWRIALVRGRTAADGGSPLTYAPITGGQVLQYMAVAVTPDPAGRFTLTGVPAGTWQVALLAPEGMATPTLAALSVRGDPGQFSVFAAGRRDLGTIRLNR